MVNKKELATCKRRGHESRGLSDGWKQCKWCGIWSREVRTIEECEDEPPKDEQDAFDKLLRKSEAGVASVAGAPQGAGRRRLPERTRRSRE